MFLTHPMSAAVRKALLIITPIALVTGCAEDGAQGPQGEQGPQGVSGIQGIAGTNGQNGIDGANGADGSDGVDGINGVNADGVNANVAIRIATVPSGAEVTGAFVTAEGDLFFNFQHPDDVNDSVDQDGKAHNLGGVGVIEGVNFNKLPNRIRETAVPVTNDEKELVQVFAGNYKVLGQYGDTFGGGLPNGLGKIVGASGSQNPGSVAEGWPDFNGFISTGAGEGYLFTNWEYFPGGMSRMKVTKDGVSGEWSVDTTDVSMLDFGTYGTVANCFGTVTPWNTPLTSEEWGNMGDATWAWNNSAVNSASRDELGAFISSDNSLFPNTYRYHYIVEITDPAGSATPVKRVALGRYEHENAVVMPDGKTVYLSQDNTDGVFFKFVADTAEDLSAGTLYAAKLTQDAGETDPVTAGFSIEWIELAHGTETEINAWIAEYDAIDTSDYVDGRSSYLTDADAIAWAAGAANYGTADVQSTAAVNAGYENAETYPGAVTAGAAMDDRIAFLESRKAARAKGATAEWRKFEGININTARAKALVEDGDASTTAYVYFAISDIDRGMIDGKGDIQLESTIKDCGGVYRMALENDYNVSRIEPVIMGAVQRNIEGLEKCDANYIAQPDNVVVLEDGRILIGEDGGQANNALWIFDPKLN